MRVRLMGLPTTLVLVEGESYRVGQLGAFLRVPLGYTSLYGVCTQVGADAAPPLIPEDAQPPVTLDPEPAHADYRWLTPSLSSARRLAATSIVASVNIQLWVMRFTS